MMSDYFIDWRGQQRNGQIFLNLSVGGDGTFCYNRHSLQVPSLLKALSECSKEVATGD